jgi:hypothetical protein
MAIPLISNEVNCLVMVCSGLESRWDAAVSKMSPPPLLHPKNYSDLLPRNTQ